MKQKIYISHTTSDHADFIDLCRQLDAHLNELAGGEKNCTEYVPHNHMNKTNPVWIAYQQGVPTGCAALKEISSDAAEVKRVFVHPEYRGNGIAEQPMRKLEVAGKRHGYQYFVLETGKAFTAAVSLYKKLGYSVIENYGPHVNFPASVCMKKKLR